MVECAPDWPATLRRASFRGARFWVETDSIKYGRRVKVHEFPHRDRPFVEDLGEKAIEVVMTAYVASNDVLSEQAALVRACRKGGAGTLVLPVEGAMQVFPHQCERQFSKDKLGLIAFSLAFHEAGAGFGTATAGFLAQLVSVAAGGAIQAIGEDFLRTFNTLGEASWVVAGASRMIGDWLVAIDSVRLDVLGASQSPVTEAQQVIGAIASSPRSAASVVLDAGELARRVEGVAHEILSAHRDMDDLAIAGRGVIRVGDQSIDLAREDVQGEIVARIDAILGGIRQAAATQEIAAEALSQIAAIEIATIGDDETVGTTAAVERANERALGSMIRRIALVQYALALSDADYANRRVAIQARADLAEAFERELSSASGTAFAALDETRNRAIAAISRKVADRRPTMTIEAHASQPALVWAWRLYRDATREVELVNRNRVRHPTFMPAVFEADAS